MHSYLDIKNTIFSNPTDLDYLLLPDCGYKYHDTIKGRAAVVVNKVDMQETLRIDGNKWYVKERKIARLPHPQAHIYVDTAELASGTTISEGRNGQYIPDQKDSVIHAFSASGKPNHQARRYVVSPAKWCEEYAWVYITTDLDTYYYVPHEYYRERLQFDELHQLHFFIQEKNNKRIYVTMLRHYKAIKPQLVRELSSFLIESGAVLSEAVPQVNNANNTASYSPDIIEKTMVIAMNESLLFLPNAGEEEGLIATLKMQPNFFVTQQNQTVEVISKNKNLCLYDEIQQLYPKIKIWMPLLNYQNLTIFGFSVNPKLQLSVFYLINTNAADIDLSLALSEKLREHQILQEIFEVQCSTSGQSLQFNYKIESRWLLDEVYRIDLREVLRSLLVGYKDEVEKLIQYLLHNAIDSRILDWTTPSYDDYDDVIDAPIYSHNEIPQNDKGATASKKRPLDNQNQNTNALTEERGFIYRQHFFAESNDTTNNTSKKQAVEKRETYQSKRNDF